MLADVFFPDTIGGAGRVAYHLSLELSRKGHCVHVITRNRGGGLQSYEKLNKNFYIHRFFTPYRESVSFIISEIKNSYFLSKKLRASINFDLACIHQSLAAIGPFFSGVTKGIPIFYNYYSPWNEEFLIKKADIQGKTTQVVRLFALIMKWIEKRILFRSGRVFPNSQFMSNKVIENHHYPGKRVIVNPGGIELGRFHLPEGGKIAAKAKIELPQDKIIFLTLRNLVPRMGLENLIKAFHRSKLLQRKSLLLIGGRGFMEARLKGMTADFHLENSIRFMGHVPDGDLPTLYQAADFFVLPTSKLEGFGLVILEALASGTPVLGTPVGAIPEILGGFDKKLIFNGTGRKEIQEKLEQVLRVPEKYSFAPQTCRAFVESRFSWAKVANRFESEAFRALKS